MRKLFIIPFLALPVILAGCNGEPKDPYSDDAIAENKTFQNLEKSVNKAMKPKPQGQDEVPPSEP